MVYKRYFNPAEPQPGVSRNGTLQLAQAVKRQAANFNSRHIWNIYNKKKNEISCRNWTNWQCGCTSLRMGTIFFWGFWKKEKVQGWNYESAMHFTFICRSSCRSHLLRGAERLIRGFCICFIRKSTLDEMYRILLKVVWLSLLQIIRILRRLLITLKKSFFLSSCWWQVVDQSELFLLRYSCCCWYCYFSSELGFKALQ